MSLEVEEYAEQCRRWPESGRVILAQYDSDSVVVYQAYRPDIGEFAASHGYFGGEFSLSRMSWIKPNFLWMMYRCGWGRKQGQEVVLAVRIRRRFFDEILREAVPSSFAPELYESERDWKEALRRSQVRLQWDPDHDPRGRKLERRAIQLGLRDEMLRRYARDEVIAIQDVSELVAAERVHAALPGFGDLVTPLERVYPVEDPKAARQLGLSER